MPHKIPEIKLQKVALGVAQGMSLRRAAIGADVAETTARRWSAEPRFKALVIEHRRRMVAVAVGKLSRAAGRAASKLARLLNSPDENVSLRAARGILADLMAIDSHAELSERLAALEVKLAAQEATDALKL